MQTLIHSLFCGLTLLSGAALADEPATAMAPQQQWRGNLSDQTSAEPSAWRLFDERQWREFWARNYHQESPPLPNLPRCSVLVVAGGQRPTGGYQLEVVRAVNESGRRVVEFVVHKPASGAFVTQALTYPAAVAIFSETSIIRPEVRDVSPPDPVRR